VHNLGLLLLFLTAHFFFYTFTTVHAIVFSVLLIYQMPKVFLTGCAGFIGSHTSEMLLNKGYQVIGIDNFDAYYSRALKEENLKTQLNHPNFTFIEGDINDYAILNALPNDIDTVVHLAAKTGVRSSIADPLGYFKANVTGTQNILGWMQKSRIKKMVFASSSSIYGNNVKVPFSESDNVEQQISPYAAAKRSAELINHVYHHLYGINIINLRFFTVFGPRQRPDLAIRKFIESISENKPVTLYGDGSSSRDYTYVGDIVQGIFNAITYLNEHENVFEIINLGNSSPISLTEMVNILYELMGSKPNIQYKPMQEGDVNRTFADIEKAKRLLKYQPSTPFKEGIQKFLSWYGITGNANK
jgi:nucleoside-diphosphate-sugar epimerase